MRPIPPRAAVAALAVLLIAGCGSVGSGTASSDAPVAPIAVSLSDCGSTWHPGPAGEQDLALHNADSRPGEVRVVGRGALRGQVYADVEPFGPGTTVRLHVRLAAGHYALDCLMEDSSPVSGPTVSLTGTTRGTPGVRTVTQSGLVHPALRYTAWVRGRLPGLVADTGRLRTLVDDGDLPAARRAWLAAHLDYQRLGAAYDAFGDLGDRIDGLPQSLPRGVHDRRWAGFHRVERDLWHHSPAPRLRLDADHLARAAARLPHLVATTELDPGTLVIRAHEICENALQFQLTGQDDFGSHTDLASVRAELAGTAEVLRTLAGPLHARVAGAGRIHRALRLARRLVSHARRQHPDVAVERLPRDLRERVDAEVSVLCERLAGIAATLEPRLADARGGSR
jgi:iron uptake system component EfeO